MCLLVSPIQSQLLMHLEYGYFDGCSCLLIHVSTFHQVSARWKWDNACSSDTPIAVNVGIAWVHRRSHDLAVIRNHLQSRDSEFSMSHYWSCTSRRGTILRCRWTEISERWNISIAYTNRPPIVRLFISLDVIAYSSGLPLLMWLSIANLCGFTLVKVQGMTGDFLV